LLFVFFFQAEDGIRDRNVTGVQTCALPISETPPSTEFSIGAMRASTAPARRSAAAVATEEKGTSSGSGAANSSGVSARACRRAWWVKVVSGPRNPYRMGKEYSRGRGRSGAGDQALGRGSAPSQ